MPHHCHAKDCTLETAPRLLMCPRHWGMVPKDLQRRVWATYRDGQEQDKKPSADYLAAARAAINAVALKESKATAPDGLAAYWTNGLMQLISPACARIEIAGSIRRGKADPRDGELVIIPIYQRTSAVDFFGASTETQVVNEFEALLPFLYEGGEWGLDHITKRDGPKYKRLRHRESGVCVDVFTATPASWGVQFCIRTGPAEFSTALVTRARQLNYHVHEGRLHLHPILRIAGAEEKCQRGDACPRLADTAEEWAFLAALGLPYIEPADRNLDRLTREFKRAAYVKSIGGQYP